MTHRYENQMRNLIHFCFNLSAVVVKKWTENLPIASSFLTLRAKNVEEKEFHVVSVSEERRGVFSAYESLFICQHCGAVIKQAGPVQIVCSYIEMAYQSITPRGFVEAVSLRFV